MSRCVGLGFVNVESLVADRHALASKKRVPVIVGDAPPWPFVDHGLMALKARAFLPLEGSDREHAELDALDALPGSFVPREDLDAALLLFPVAHGLELLDGGVQDATRDGPRAVLDRERGLESCLCGARRCDSRARPRCSAGSCAPARSMSSFISTPMTRPFGPTT